MSNGRYEYMGFWFRGLHKDIETLIERYKEGRRIVSIGEITKVSDNVSEVALFFLHDDNLVKEFPQLKVVGFVEDWTDKSGEVWFSDCGTTEYQKEFVDYFDGHDEERWTGNNPTEDFNAEQLYISCGETEYITYKFPFREEWNKENFEKAR